MKGLLIKDLLVLKKHCAIHIGLIVLFTVISCLADSSSIFYSALAVLMASIMTTITFAFDESTRWEKYQAIIPLKKIIVVTEKYFLVFIFVLILTVIFAINLVVRFDSSIDSVLDKVSSFCTLGIILPAFMFPFMFRFGYIKAKMINIIISVFLVLSLYTSNIGFDFISVPDAGNHAVSYKFSLIIIIAVFLLFIMSWLFSLLLYSKKEIK